nr:hypothetical protein [Tanacetum cinerariifolium]
MLLDTYICYLQVINDLKKFGYSKDNCELNFKFLNNLQPEWKQYATMMRQTKNLMDINIDALYNILKQNQGDVNDVMGLKKKTVVVTSDPLALIAEKTKVSKRKENVVVFLDSEGSDEDDFKFVKYDDKKEEKKVEEKKRDMSKVKCYNCKKEGHFAKDYKKANVKDYEYYKTKMLLAKKDKDEQVLVRSIAALWLEKVVTPLIVPAIKVEFRRISLTWFHSCISRSQTGASQNRQTRFKYFGRLCPSEIYRLISLALDSISALLLFGDRRLERTATYSISTISE